VIARFDQMYIAAEGVGVAMSCDICGKQIAAPTLTLGVDEIIRLAAVHQSTDHA